MDVACDKCEAKFKIPDEKVPKGQSFSLACPKCKNKITVDPRSAGGAQAGDDKEEKGGGAVSEAADADSYDAEDKPFDFLEEGAETALLCESEPDVRAQIRSALQDLGYQIREPKTPIEALKQMRFHVFDVIVLDELFGTEDPDENNVLRFLERMAMDTRRDIFLTLITERFRTNDHMAAFNKSVNLIVNRKNVGDFATIIKRGVAENVAFYRVFREAMLKTGRA
jgi:CheY-like chemotaxis protein